uniref:Piwi-like RNA-mediated gene silencing 1 n=1 Tax=Eptatretus burgeri TaxID=7764 RepID=A0A8C4PYR5_EPTBU
MPISPLLECVVGLLSAGMQGMSMMERGGRRRRNPYDVDVCTRKHMEHVVQSKQGTSGREIHLLANFFRLNSRPNWLVHQYHVEFTPEMYSSKLRYALVNSQTQLLGTSIAFEGSILYSLTKLGKKVEEVFTKTRKGEDVKITFTLTSSFPPSSTSTLHLYNIIFKRILRLMDMQQVGRHYYNPKEPIIVPQHRLMIWSGFATAILSYESCVMLCMDLSHKILRNDTVLDIMYNLYEQTTNEGFHDACTRDLVGQIILTRYNNRTYRVDDIEWDRNPQMLFKKTDGSEISYVDYFMQHYNQSVTDMSQPLLVSRVRRRNPQGGASTEMVLHLLPEFSFLTGLSDKIRSDYNVMRELAQHTRVDPQQRSAVLQRFMDCINSNKDVKEMMNNWGLAFDKGLVNLSSRVLPTERLSQNGHTYSYNPNAAEWSRECRGLRLISAVSLTDWILVFARRCKDGARTLMQFLCRVGPPMGMNISPAIMVEVDDRTEAFLRAFQQHITSSTQMVMCLLPSNRPDKYSAVKRYLCVERPIPSQCVVARTISRPHTVMSIATKIAVQMNCKLGGELWEVEIPLKDLMVIGVDTYHDNSLRGSSIAGFVASLNGRLTRWYSRAILQHPGQELTDGLKVCINAAVKKWSSVNQKLPSRVVLYRDGVGDGQLAMVVNYEIPQLLDCLYALSENFQPRVTVVVVKKSGNARFFAKMNSGLGNPPPGTVIDSLVTRPEWYDFYVISQSVRQGTVSPTHYNVVFDTSFMKPDHMQRLTYKMCHLYYNWPGIIRVPAPCLYAHKLAFLVGQSIHREPSLLLSDRLFYL